MAFELNGAAMYLPRWSISEGMKADFQHSFYIP